MQGASLRVRNDFFIFEPLQWQYRLPERWKILVKQNPLGSTAAPGNLKGFFIQRNAN